MRLEIPSKTLSERQKANIVSRGENLSRNNLYFEIDMKYAATLAKMSNTYGEHFKVDEEMKYIFLDDRVMKTRVYGYTADGAWKELIPGINPAHQLAEMYAGGEIQLGGNADSIMQKIAESYIKTTEIEANNARIAAEKKRKEEEERPEREEKERAEREEKERAEKRRKEEEKEKAKTKRAKMLAWAQEHGSDRLRKGLEHGHTCRKLYETELGETLIDNSGYVYDRERAVEEKDRSCPSLESLEEVERIEKIEGLSAKVVWLPNSLAEMYKDPEEYSEPEHGCEAVQVDVLGTAGYWYLKF